ncbi:NAD(P)H-dependent glycerol-3-phosphate dehydrogenase [Williamsoniiplasma somnilux]|uniref:Glycerol-3-phosphate dehydrogenase [NAD(P)+] n=1 Tax=Williamsoniiplasma somnilux TaxID=215578 RepID=A0A2K8NYE7_9MOLU|nr:NAD(P)H-dependent glycerol-3-phosphate dehydrogenase [Williamsoniiplasma somnilux]ATZ18839.1 NAD(P)H-dependent glycerol-3-phosphate dehydrogenase [Williamsoniiplasma somnilux]
MKNITIIGTGAYGTCLANVLADNGHSVVMYGIVETQVNDLNINHKNSTFLGDIKFNQNIKATTDLSAALEKTDILILGVPTVALKSVIKDIIKYAKNEMIIINTAKGLDEENLGLLSDLIKREFAESKMMKEYAALYGPSIASEVAQRKPTALMLCSDKLEVAKDLAKIFSNEYFYVYPWNDLAGCEIAAALKNTVAIGSGILFGFEAGDNAQASLITVGANEMFLIGSQFGARLETFFNFAGLGDLILTASSQKSRNFTLGRKIAKYNSAKIAMENYKLTVEGVGSAKIAFNLCKKYNLKTSLFENMFQILYNDTKPIALINNVFNDVKLV